MTDKLFDSFIKNKLQHHESEVPEGLWEKIEQKKEKKPKAFWWFNNTFILIGIASAFAIGVGAYALTKKENKSEVLATTTKVETKVNNDITVAKSNSPIEEANNIEPQNTEAVNATNTASNSAKSNATELSSLETKQTSQLNNTEANSSLTSNSTLSINKEKNKTKVSNKIVKEVKSKTSKNNNLLSNSIEEKENGASNILASLKSNKSNTNAYSISRKNKKATTKIGFDDNVSNPYNPIQAEIVANSFSLMSNAYLTNKKIDFNLGNLFGKGDDCPTANGSSRNDFYLEVYGSPDFTFKKVVNSKQGLDAYLNKKDSVEVLRGGFTIGARVIKSINNNLLIKAGIQYSQTNEQFKLRTENERRQTIVINTRTITRPGLNDTTISDTSTKVEIGYRVQTNMNYYRNFEVPIILSYEFNTNKNWKVALNGGAIINLTSWYEGRTLDSSFKMVSLNTKSGGSFYQQKIGVNLYGGLSIIRRINDKVEIFAEPYYRFSLNNIQAKEGYNQRVNALGLQLGARIRLSKFLGVF